MTVFVLFPSRDCGSRNADSCAGLCCNANWHRRSGLVAPTLLSAAPSPTQPPFKSRRPARACGSTCAASQLPVPLTLPQSQTALTTAASARTARSRTPFPPRLRRSTRCSFVRRFPARLATLSRCPGVTCCAAHQPLPSSTTPTAPSCAPLAPPAVTAAWRT